MRRKPLLWLRSVLLPLLLSQPLHRKPLKRLLPLRQVHKRLQSNPLLGNTSTKKKRLSEKGGLFAFLEKNVFLFVYVGKMLYLCPRFARK